MQKNKSNSPKLQNRQFSYGPCTSPCQICFTITFCPFFCGLANCTAYNKIIFNEQKQQLEKYGQGCDLYYACCCKPTLQTVIPYQNIISIKPFVFTQYWHIDQGEVHSPVSGLVLALRDQTQVFYLPENACYSPNNCCCMWPFTVLAGDCYRDRYQRICGQIAGHWQDRNNRMQVRPVWDGRNQGNGCRRQYVCRYDII